MGFLGRARDQLALQEIGLEVVLIGELSEGCCGGRVPAVAAEEAGRKTMAMILITITPRADAAAEHDPKPRDNRGVAAATDPNTFQDHDGVQHHDDQAA